MRCASVVILEGPTPVAEVAEEVKQAAADANSALWMLSHGESGARERFDEARRIFRFRLDSFIGAARTAMQSPN